MADRRMYSKRVVRSARFLKMPVSSRELYWQLGIEADDDGIVEAFNVMRTVGATEDDLRVLVSKGFVQVLNEDLVTYILDWNENNKLRADRKVDSIYKDLLIQFNPDVKLLQPKPRADTKKLTGESKMNSGRPMDSIGKDSIGEVSIVEESSDKKINKERKTIFGEYKNVRLTESELQSLRSDYGDNLTQQLITYLDEYIEMKGYKAKSHYLCIKKWVIKAVKEQGTKKGREPIRKEKLPDWFNQEIKAEPCSPEELAEMEKLLSNYKTDDPKPKEKKEDAPCISYQEYIESLENKEEGKEDWRKEAEELRQKLNEKY